MTGASGWPAMGRIAGYLAAAQADKQRADPRRSSLAEIT